MKKDNRPNFYHIKKVVLIYFRFSVQWYLTLLLHTASQPSDDDNLGYLLCLTNPDPHPSWLPPSFPCHIHTLPSARHCHHRCSRNNPSVLFSLAVQGATWWKLIKNYYFPAKTETEHSVYEQYTDNIRCNTGCNTLKKTYFFLCSLSSGIASESGLRSSSALIKDWALITTLAILNEGPFCVFLAAEAKQKNKNISLFEYNLKQLPILHQIHIFVPVELQLNLFYDE